MSKLLLLGAACAVFGFPAGTACAQKLVRAELDTKTGDDNKDKDTGVYVTVSSSDGKTLLAAIKNAHCAGRDQTEFNDHSEHTTKLVIESPGSTKADCQDFRFRVGSQAKGNDKWKVAKARLTLYFDDGTSLSKEVGGFELNSRKSAVVESEWFGGGK